MSKDKIQDVTENTI